MFQEFFFDIFLPSPVFQRPFDIILAISFSFPYFLSIEKNITDINTVIFSLITI